MDNNQLNQNGYNQQSQPYYNNQQHQYYPNNQNFDPNSLPMTMKDWLITLLLLCIPIVNIVLAFVWAFGSNVNKSKKSFFQAYLILMAIGIGIYIIFAIIIAILAFTYASSSFIY